MFAQLARRVALTSPLRMLPRRAASSSRLGTSAGLSTESAAGADDKPLRPTLSEVKLLPRHVSEYSPELLISCALHGDPDAIRERLTREVMRVDGVEWREANATVDEIHDSNGSGIGMLKLPYVLGIGVGFISAWGCLPLVFDLEVAEAFNTAYVTTEHPQPEDVETWLEVGAWTWNWMEPLLGTISFQLLALQLMRNQMINVGFKPYTGFILSSRANRLADMYPSYNRGIVREFSKSDTGLGAYSGITG